VAAKAKLVEKIHAVSMLLAWILFANLGAFTARYCKTIFQVQGWPNLPLSHLHSLLFLLPDTARLYSRYRAGLTSPSVTVRYCKTVFQVQGWYAISCLTARYRKTIF
jgi:hypothetical protein